METAMQVALKKAEVAKASKVGSVLPELDKIDVVVVTDEQLAAIAVESQVRKKWAETAGIKKSRIQRQIARLTANAAIAFSEKGKEALRKLEGALVQIDSVADETIRARVNFAALLEDIRTVDCGSTQAVVETLCRLVAEKRFTEPDKAAIKALPKENGKTFWPAGTIFFPGMILFSCRAENGEANGAQKAVEAEARRMVDGYKKGLAVRIQNPAYASHDLSALEAGKLGRYYLYIPSREDKGYRWSDGHLIVEVSQRDSVQPGGEPVQSVKICDATGSCASLATEEGLKSILFFWLAQGKVISAQPMSEKNFGRAVRILRTLQSGIAHWKAEQAKPAEPVKVEVTVAPAVPKPRVTKKAKAEIRAEASA